VSSNSSSALHSPSRDLHVPLVPPELALILLLELVPDLLQQTSDLNVLCFGLLVSISWRRGRGERESMKGEDISFRESGDVPGELNRGWK